MTELKGILPVLVTPFTPDEQVDHEALSRQVDYLIACEVQACAFGFGSEIVRLTERELDAALETAVTHARGRVAVIANIGAASVAAAVERVRIASELGAAAIMMPPPYPASMSDEAIFAYFESVAGQTNLPIIVQDAPAATTIEMSTQLLSRLANELESVRALKVETTPSPDKIEALVDLVSGSGTTVLGGTGGVDFYQELERGAAGTMPGPAFPMLFQRILTEYSEGRASEARIIFNRALPLLIASARTGDRFLFVQKEVLRRRGVLTSARLRAPNEEVSPGFLRELDLLISDAQLDLLSSLVPV